MPQTRTIDLGRDRQVTGTLYGASGEACATFVMAHGAGAGQDSAFITSYAVGMASRGLDVLTFDFPYTERRQRPPDPQPVLDACFRSVLDHVGADPVLGRRPLFIGGKSMGGRMASHIAASLARGPQDPPAWQAQLRGLVFLGYPLHPPARPQQVRVDHLPRIIHPMLFVQGERDAFGSPDELRTFVNVLPAPCTLHVVEHGDHSFDVLKRSGIPQGVVHTAIQDAIAHWIRQLAHTNTDVR
jgi:predicted alpha/beta-hydrolase family hydrolase